MALKLHMTSVILILFIVLPGTDCLAKNSTNPFQGSWVNDYGSVNITHCNEKRCKIEINTTNGAHTCDLQEQLITLSSHDAIFQLKGENIEGLNKIVPINLSRSKQLITVTIPEESKNIARGYCGLRGFFEGEYTSSNAQRLYKSSFDCNKAKTQIEFAICHIPELAQADLVLSQLYIQLKSQKIDNIVNQQKEWLKDRNTCYNSAVISQCLSDKYRNRILELQAKSIYSEASSNKIKEDLTYNYSYLLLLSKDRPYDIFADPPLQYYLNIALPKSTVQKIIPAVFHEIQLEDTDDSLIMLTGGAPGLYTICEGALVLTKEHQTWLAYININNQQEKEIIIFRPKNENSNKLPEPLSKWVDSLLPHMDNKNLIYTRFTI